MPGSLSMPPAILILFKAFLLARGSGASEISVSTLLDAFEVDFDPMQSGTEGPFVPVPQEDIPFSAAAAAALAAAGDLETVSLDQLRDALVNADE